MDRNPRLDALDARRMRRLRLSPREVNLALEFVFVALIASGVLSWVVALDRAWILTTVHSIAGFALVVLLPFKFSGSVRSGWPRRRWTRWGSAIFGITVVACLPLGYLHTTRIWWGLGYWEAMWTHLLLGFVSIPLFIFHVATRPVRPGRVDMHRRSLLSGSAVLAAGGAAWAVQETIFRVTGAQSANRGGTGSHELASFDPDNMPSKQWINDSAPGIDVDDWDLRIEGRFTPVAELKAQATSLTAWLDCTDGWRSQQRWDVVPMSKLLSDNQARSFRVTSATGYRRLFSRGDADKIYLCIGYDGRPLKRGHGAPVRLVAPNRRGPWWIKWVTEVELSDQPAWLQLPFPAT